MAIGATRDVGEELGRLEAFGHLSFYTLVQHRDDAAHHLQVA